MPHLSILILFYPLSPNISFSTPDWVGHMGRPSRTRWVRKRDSSLKETIDNAFLNIANKSIAAQAYAVREGKDHRLLAVDQNTNETFKSILIGLGMTKLPVMVQVIQPYPISFVGNMRLKRNRIYISVPKSLRNIHEALWHDGRTFPIIITPLTVAMTHVR